MQVKGSGTAGFTGLTYTAPGDYRYTVRQCAGGTAHMTYDATVYTVTVRVTNQPDGGLGAEIWATGGSSEKTGLLLFQNRYDPPAAPTPTPAPAKTTPVPAHPAPKPALPQTADPMPVTLLAALAVLSAGGLMGLYYNKYGERRENNNLGKGIPFEGSLIPPPAPRPGAFLCIPIKILLNPTNCGTMR